MLERLLVFLVWVVVLLAAALASGARERRSLGLPWGRWLTTTALIVVCATAPGVPAVLLGVRPSGLVRTWVVEDGDEPPIELVEDLRVGSAPTGLDTGIACLVMGLFAILLVRPLHRHLNLPSELPAVDQLPIRERIVELASRMGTPPPRVVWLGTLDATLEVQAMAAGLFAPTVVVTDGLVHRLEANDRDAVFAHELAHLARRSIWRRWGAITACGLAVSVASIWLGPFCPLALGVVLLTSAMPYYTQRDELACDHRAGSVVGQARMAAALEVVHAVRQQELRGWLGALLSAFRSHPSRELRAAALLAAANADEQRAIQVDMREVRRQRIATGGIRLLWIGLAATAVWQARDGQFDGGPFAALTGLALAPPIAVLLTRMPRLWLTWRLGGLPGPARFARTCAWTTLVVMAAVALAIAGYWQLGLALVITDILASWTLSWFSSRRRKRIAAIDQALREHQFSRAVELFRALPPRTARLPEAGVSGALALAASGDREAALRELTELARRRPRFRLATLWHVRLLRDQDPAGALALLESLPAGIQRHALIRAHTARVLLQMGRVADADALLTKALAQLPDDGVIHSWAARAAAVSGKLEAAARHMACASRLAQGDAAAELAAVAVAAAQRDRGAAQAALERARAAVTRQPLAFLERDFSDLERAVHSL